MLIRLFLASIAALMLAALPSACQARPPYSGDMVFRTDIGVAQCSATAIGPHTLLTAAHCLVGEVRSIELQGIKDKLVVEVVGIERDGSDHALVRVKHTFTAWPQVGAAPKLGDPIYIRGNPRILHDILRFGRVAGFSELPKDEVGDDPVLSKRFTFYDIQVTGGDSGSGIFDLRGKLVGVVSIKTSPATAEVNLAGSLPFAFTAKQWEQARK